MNDNLLQELEAREAAVEQEREAQRVRIVEEERQKLLKRHATQLLGYLPQVQKGGSHTLITHSCTLYGKLTESVSLPRACCVRKTLSTWMKTSGKTFYLVRRRRMLWKTMIWFLTDRNMLLHSLIQTMQSTCWTVTPPLPFKSLSEEADIWLMSWPSFILLPSRLWKWLTAVDRRRCSVATLLTEMFNG